MKIQFDAEAGQSFESFAMELCWVARRLPAYVWIGRFNGTEVEATPDVVPSELARQYYSKRKEPSIYDGVIGVPGQKLEGGFR